MLKLNVKDEAGVAMLYVIVAMSVVFILVAGIATVSMSENMQALYQYEEVTAYYVARAGAEAMVSELKRMNNVKYQQFNTIQEAEAFDVFDSDGDGIGDVGDLHVIVERDGDHYIIESTGSYLEATETVALRMIYREKYEVDYAAYANSDMGDDSPTGDISIKTIQGGIASGGNIHIKDADIGKAVGEDEIIPNYHLNINIVVPDMTGIVCDDDVNNPKNALNISTSTELRHLDTTKKITVNTSNADYVKDDYEDFDEKFTMTNVPNGSGDWMILYLSDKAVATKGIEVNGDKNLMIIVEDAFYLDGGITINDNVQVEIYVVDDSGDSSGDVSSNNSNSNGDYDLVIKGSDDYGVVNDSDHLFVYLYGNRNSDETINKHNKMAMNNNSDFYGYIFGPEATVDLKNGGTMIYGAVYADEISFEASVSIINPEGLVSDYSIYKEMQIDYWE